MANGTGNAVEDFERIENLKTQIDVKTRPALISVGRVGLDYGIFCQFKR